MECMVHGSVMSGPGVGNDYGTIVGGKPGKSGSLAAH